MILPVLLPDGDLDWAAYDGPRSLVPPAAGCSSPRAAGSGRTPWRRPTRCWCPVWPSTPTAYGSAAAAAPTTGRSGRVPVGTFTCVLLYDDEVGVPVPVEPHDRPVRLGRDAAGVVRLAS